MFIYLLIIVLIYFIYKNFLKPTKYWKDRGVPHQKPVPLLGNLGPFVMKKKHLLAITDELYNLYPDRRYIGMFQFKSPLLIIRDLDLIKSITIKNFDHFTDHLSFLPPGADKFLDKTLLGLSGKAWREMRSTLSPAFTSAKMKNMFVLISEVGQNFTKFFINKNESCIEIEVKEIFSRFTMDIIASTSFGISNDSLANPDNEFFQSGSFLTKFGLLQNIKLIIAQISPTLTKLLGGGLFPKHVTDFMHHLVIDTIKEREEKNILRPDLLQLLSDARKGKLKHDNTIRDQNVGYATVEESDIGKKDEYQKKEWTDDDVTAQALIFFFAGYDTSATAAGFTAYELTMNPNVQQKLQNEIDSVRLECKDGKVTYEALLKLKYLDQVISESLRKWPPGFQADRKCVKKFEIPPEQPDEKPLIIEEGIGILFPIYSIHRNPQYYPNPDKFDPERFSDENKRNIVPGSYMPFGGGPRNCIGSRFALLTLKSLFFYLLSDFDLVKTDKTVPFVVDPAVSVNLSPQGIQLGLKPRKKTV